MNVADERTYPGFRTPWSGFNVAKRTLAQASRKIIVGSTPTEEGISVVERLYSESDQRAYEVPCSAYGAFREIMWEDIVCEIEHDPTTAKYLCGGCGILVD